MSIYQSLSVEKHETRLLVLEPAPNKTDPLKAQLQVVSLDDSPDYQCLSYVWGEAEKPSTITLSFKDSTKDLAITENLGLALQGLRPPATPLTIWADAICINQDDILERNNQVALMGPIYKYASSVTAFFRESDGGDAENAASVISIIRAVTANPDHHFVTTMEPHHPEEIRNLRAVFSLMSLFRVEWWHRVWTVQESVLAAKLNILWGGHSIPFDDLRPFCFALKQHRRLCCHDFEPVEGTNLVWNVERQLSIVEHLVKYQQRSGSLDWLDIMADFRYRKATDLRDKIYGLAALSTLPSEFVNYNLSVVDVYTHFALMMIQNSENLDVFSHIFTTVPGAIYHDKTPLALPGLPSWAPNWSLELKNASSDLWKHRHEFIEAYNASEDTKAVAEYLGSGRIRLRGVVFDKVAKVGPENTQPNVFMAYLTGEWEAVAGIGESNTLETAHVKYGERYRDFRRALTWELGAVRLVDMVGDDEEEEVQEVKGSRRRRADDLRDRLTYEVWRHEQPILSEEDMEENGEILRSVSEQDVGYLTGTIEQLTLGKRFALTEAGMMAFVPAEAEVGDPVCVLFGGKTPYALRETGEEGVFEILGDAYVQGAMDGEVVYLAESGGGIYEVSDIVLK
ncbi:hypothetical protein OQA88_9010 [Cercophora sp. LCS_1]